MAFRPLLPGILSSGGASGPEFLDHDATNTDESVLDFTNLTFESGDLLVAVITGQNNTDVGTLAPAGFTNFFAAADFRVDVGIWYKIASGSETTIAVPSDTRTTNTVYSFRNAAVGLVAAVDQSKDSPSIANSAGDIVFSLAADDTSVGSTTSPPSGYTLLFGGFVISRTVQRMAYRENAPANENPGIWVHDVSANNSTTVTFSITSA